eukprot:2949495-Amphidinium_carterae.2
MFDGAKRSAWVSGTGSVNLMRALSGSRMLSHTQADHILVYIEFKVRRLQRPAPMTGIVEGDTGLLQEWAESNIGVFVASHHSD